VTHHSGGQVLKDAGPGPDNRIIADGDAGGHIDIRGNPHPVAHGYGLVGGLETGIVIIMPRSAQKALLGDDRMLADLDGGDGIEPGVVADPGTIADFDAPGIVQAGPGMD